MDRFLEIKEKVVPLVLPYGVKRVAVFGSFVRGEHSPQSDIDLLITLKPRGQRRLRTPACACQLARLH